MLVLESKHHNHDPTYYIEEVLGIRPSSLLSEGVSYAGIEQQIIKEHLLLEGWLNNAASWLKDKSAEGWEALKQKGTNAKDAVKKFPGRIEKVVASIYALARGNRLKSFRRVASGIFSDKIKPIKELIDKFKSLLGLSIENESGDAGKFKKIIKKVIKFIEGIIETIWNIGSGKSWANTISRVGRNIVWDIISGKLGLTEKIESLGNAVEEAKQAIISGTGLEGILETIEEKFSFFEELKNMVINAVKDIIGPDVIAAMSGPIGWIKKIMDVMKVGNEVLGILEDNVTDDIPDSMMIVMTPSQNESLLREFVYQVIREAHDHQRMRSRFNPHTYSR